MIVTVTKSSDPGRVAAALAEHGLWVRRHDAGDRVQFLVQEHSSAIDVDLVRAISGVESVATARSATPLVDAMSGIVDVSGVPIGSGAPPVIMAGPCSIESEERVHALAAQLAPLGVQFLRGGAYKPRTSPYSFQGHGATALRWMSEAARAHGLRVVTEAMAADEVGVVAEYADLVQIGSRNMHNYSLLRTTGAAGRPVLLKRGMSATIEEWLAAGEYLLLAGAPSVVFCERGIRGFDPETRNVLDLGAVALLAHVHGVPVVVDPSHASGRRDIVPALARAALAAGASGLLVETHDAPGEALSDGPQALRPERIAELLYAGAAS